MKELIRKILREDLEYLQVSNASPKNDNYGLSESVTKGKDKFNVIDKKTGEIIDDGLPKDLALKLATKKNGWVIEKVGDIEDLDLKTKEFLFKYWNENGTHKTPFRYIGLDELTHELEVDKLKVEFYGGYDKALELLKEELGIGKKVHISDAGYEFDFTPLDLSIIEQRTDNPDKNPYDVDLGVNGLVTDGSVRLLNDNDNYKWDFDELFSGNNDIDEDTLYEIIGEISIAIREHLFNVFDKYGLFIGGLHHNYKDAWRK
jgi:hypothetical protein